MQGNISRCPFCGSYENIPDGTFRGTVEGLIRILSDATDPLHEAKQLLESLNKVREPRDLDQLKSSPRFQKYDKWLPNSPEKIAAYIAIVYTFVQLMMTQPKEVNNYSTFIKQYNQTIIQVINDQKK